MGEKNYYQIYFIHLLKNQTNYFYMKQFLSLFTLIILALAFSITNINCTHSQNTNTSKTDIAIFETSLGTFEVELYSDKAPLTVTRIKELISQHFYDGIIFHRVIDGFMIQAGDPTGTGYNGSGKTIPDEFKNGLKHDKEGVVAMANTGEKNSQDSQFYITLGPQTHLDGKYTIFGQVISGMDIVKKIGKVKTDSRDKPVKDVKINSITLEEK